MILHLTSHLDRNFGGHLTAALERLLGITLLDKRCQKMRFYLCSLFTLVFNTWHSICILHFEKGVDTWWQARWGTWEHTLWVAGTSTLWQDRTWWSGSWSRCRSALIWERWGSTHHHHIRLRYFWKPTVFSFCSSWQIGGSCSVWQTWSLQRKLCSWSTLHKYGSIIML